MPRKNHKKFNVGRYMKLWKEEQDHVLKENTKLLNCIENEERKLKTQRMKTSVQGKLNVFISIWPVSDTENFQKTIVFLMIPMLDYSVYKFVDITLHLSVIMRKPL